MSCHHFNKNDDLITLENCSHQICKQCLYYYIQDEFACRIKCPVTSCYRDISDREIRQFLSDSDERRYDFLSLLSCTTKCMTLNCTYFCYTEDRNKNFTCPQCEQPNCVKCKARHSRNECGRRNQKSEEKRDLKAKSVLQNKRIKKLHDYDEKLDLLPAHIGFGCFICCEFILPKDAVMLRCGCSHCKSCLFEVIREKNYMNQLICQTCGTELAEIEKVAIKGSDNLMNMSERVLRNSMWNCRSPDCGNMWYTDKTYGFINCSRCYKPNCLSCKFVHDGMTCEQFRQNRSYQMAQLR